ncbi:MAG: GTPase domain-containing protein [Candidatus Hodarchaeota archaeon]
MVSIGILGTQDCGKTSVFVHFINVITGSQNEKIISGSPGGPEMHKTLTVDFIRFSHKGFLHQLYGTGGHRTPIADYYRVYVLRNATRFIAMFDLSIPLGPQLEFYRQFDIPSRYQLVVYLNKFDLGADNFPEYKESIEDFFTNELKKLIKGVLPTVAIIKDDTEKYTEYNQNVVNGILSLCEFDSQSSSFDVWEASQ